VCPLLFLFLILCTGCAPEENSSSPPTLPNQKAPNTGCTPNNITEACLCADGLMGVQTCMDGRWTECFCQTSETGGDSGVLGIGTGFAPNETGYNNGGGGNSPISPGANPPQNYASVRFDWMRTIPEGGTCEAGTYLGTFDGMYGPSVMVASMPVIPIFPIDLPGLPGLVFELKREGTGEIFRVSNGEMNGNALGGFPFHSDIEGSLNCETNRFEAMMTNGTYFIGPLQYFFEGPLVADYDRMTHSMVNGTWSVTEPNYPIAGGSGTWTSTWAP